MERSGIRCPNPEPHDPHQYSLIVDGICYAGGLCDYSQWPIKEVINNDNELEGD